MTICSGSVPAWRVKSQTKARAKFGSAPGKKRRRLSFLLCKFLRSRIDRIGPVSGPTGPISRPSQSSLRNPTNSHPRDYDRWLGIDDKGGDPRPQFDLLHPFDADKMKMTPANPAVGNWRNKGPEMLDAPP